ncbi:MAG: ATP-binding cassette domain-containing protein, partial [Defluviitaleaceae bacterium]|nr:ATP-binding cassette domain-containing protein [Defluviitaleaceae bacterium]
MKSMINEASKATDASSGKSPSPAPLLQIRDLRTSFKIRGEYHAAVDGVDLDIRKNEVFALVGESGSGKSALALSITRLHNLNYTRIEGNIGFEG